MATVHTRDRVVVFRVTQDEYKLLRSTCIQRGGRNLSDFTRSEMLSFLKAATHSDDRIAAIEGKLASLQYSLQHLIRLVESPCKGVDALNGY